jgi:hypothetical protein
VRFRSSPKDSLSSEERNQLKKHESDLTFQLKSLDDKIQDYRSQMSALEVAFKNRREISENSLIEREISTNGLSRNLPILSKGKMI